MQDLLHKTIHEELTAIRKSDAPFVIGVNGIDYAGKTKFAYALKEYLETRGYSIELIHVDDFYNGDIDESFFATVTEAYLEKVYNFSKIINEVLLPLKTYKSLDTILKLWNKKSKKHDLEKKLAVTRDSIVIIEGVFLFQPDIIPYIDYKIMLLVSKIEAEKRSLTRDYKHLGISDNVALFNNEFLPAQQLFVERMAPLRYADLVVDNEDWQKPKVLKDLDLTRNIIY